MKIEHVTDSKMLIVSFFTPGYYHDVMSRYLLPGILKYRLPHYIEELTSVNTWSGNTNLKPLFLRQMLIQFPDKDLIWLDADSQINQYPSLFFTIKSKYDMGVFYLDLDSWYGNNRHKGRQELVSNILLLRKRPVTLSIIDRWIEGTQSQPLVWEQKHLQTAVEASNATVFRFPLLYSYIYQLPNGKPPKIVVDNPVIIQYQTSREVRKNGGHV